MFNWRVDDFRFAKRSAPARLLEMQSSLLEKGKAAGVWEYHHTQSPSPGPMLT